MKCAKVKKIIGDYMDNELSGEERALLEQHIKKCPDCRMVLEDFQRIRDTAESLEAYTPSEILRERILEGIVKDKQEFRTSRNSPRVRFRWAAAAVSAFLILVVGYTLVKINKTQQEISIHNYEEFIIDKLQEAQQHYSMAAANLIEVASFHYRDMPDEFRDVLQANLRVLDDSIFHCRRAVLKNPENLDSHYQLISIYRKKLDFLETMIMNSLEDPFRNKNISDV